ncbi:MAG TPA: GNAT family N-acetyltransferase [Pyrinomonadaceae bacterium]|nr:GNAT family N-acetyltransferase [Pyrinomonadaceae bacterium]
MAEIIIRECTTIEEFDNCISLQREAFGLPDLEISPRRHFIVSRQAGGWTLGAFADDRMVGFVHHLAAIRANDEIYGYSHVMAVARDYQNKGIGARLKWAQRAKAMSEGRDFIKWTWDPMQSRNAHFNLNRLGVLVHHYEANFYGLDYDLRGQQAGLPSDRLFASWHLNSPRVVTLGEGRAHTIDAQPVKTIAIPTEWSAVVKRDAQEARDMQTRVRNEFQAAFAEQLVCAGLERGDNESRYLLFRPNDLT